MNKNKTNELFELLTPDLVPEPYDEWAKILGAKRLYEFALEYGGTTLYIPKAEHITREVRNNLILQDYISGIQINELVKRYKLSERMIYQICKYRNKNKL
ncbi:MAG: hypothetical protein GX213_03310 [Clostridiaceae bacterium]|nr:hypothetical protein [Clostridiaceae bacterium]